LRRSGGRSPLDRRDGGIAELAPTGRLRAGINFGNGILAKKDPHGRLAGVHVDLAQELAQRLGLPLELVGHPAAGAMVEALADGALDVALLSVEPARTGAVTFSPAYLEIDATYLVRPDAPFRDVRDVDRDGVRIAIAAKSAYEHFLKRILRHARLVGAASTHAAFGLFASGGADALVGLRPRLLLDSRGVAGSRVLAGRFMRVEQAIATPAGRDAGARRVRDFMEDAVASGLIARLLQRHGVAGVAVPSGRS
jgi:polar amino acid transport system substrate-binding protein